ncbi:exonuclease mut-7 homolog isoform X7 [Eubalaena glacialis]|uniref:exonuclease mut-7 homolog isoform X7 n=1 Tax=Eubalaena glacialis TaxID=27606 RepID=UPI002A5A35DD|nr:exonuclease mut-7 homolog isoform X7 [Eubalaena glacialis]
MDPGDPAGDPAGEPAAGDTAGDPAGGKCVPMGRDPLLFLQTLQTLWSTRELGQLREEAQRGFAALEDPLAALLDMLDGSRGWRGKGPSLEAWVARELKRCLQAQPCPGPARGSPGLKQLQARAVKLLAESPPGLVEPLVSIFQLQDADRSPLLAHVHRLHQEGKFKEAIVLGTKLRLQADLDVEKMCIPLLLQDKADLVERYVDGFPDLQQRLLALMDSWCQPSFDIRVVASPVSQRRHPAAPGRPAVSVLQAAGREKRISGELGRACAGPGGAGPGATGAAAAAAGVSRRRGPGRPVCPGPPAARGATPSLGGRRAPPTQDPGEDGRGPSGGREGRLLPAAHLQGAPPLPGLVGGPGQAPGGAPAARPGGRHGPGVEALVRRWGPAPGVAHAGGRGGPRVPAGPAPALKSGRRAGAPGLLPAGVPAARGPLHHQAGLWDGRGPAELGCLLPGPGPGREAAAGQRGPAAGAQADAGGRQASPRRGGGRRATGPQPPGAAGAGQAPGQDAAAFQLGPAAAGRGAAGLRREPARFHLSGDLARSLRLARGERAGAGELPPLQKASASPQQVPAGEDAAPEVPARAFRVVCDSMLQGLARSLRCLGIDVLVLATGEDHRRAAEVARQEGRIILTSGLPYHKLRAQVGAGRCLSVDCSLKARQQAMAVIRHFNVRVTHSDIFSRCQMCVPHVPSWRGGQRQGPRLGAQKQKRPHQRPHGAAGSGARRQAETCVCGHTGGRWEPRGKTHLTHEAFPEPAGPLSGLLVGVRGQSKARGHPPTLTSRRELAGPGHACLETACNCHQYLKVSKDVMKQLVWLSGHPEGPSGTGDEAAQIEDERETGSAPEEAPGGCTYDPSCRWLEEEDLQSRVPATLGNGTRLQLSGVPAGVLRRPGLRHFYCCTGCGKVFWEGSHLGRVAENFREVLEGVPGSREPSRAPSPAGSPS